MKLSWLGILNFIIIQWFFTRLAKVVIIIDEEKGEYEFKEYKLLKGIIPLTGWWSDYKYIGKK